MLHAKDIFCSCHKWRTFSSLPNSPYFISGSQKSWTRLTHPFSCFYIILIYHWACSHLKYGRNTARWTLSSNQSISQWICMIYFPQDDKATNNNHSTNQTYALFFFLLFLSSNLGYTMCFVVFVWTIYLGYHSFELSLYKHLIFYLLSGHFKLMLHTFIIWYWIVSFGSTLIVLYIALRYQPQVLRLMSRHPSLAGRLHRIGSHHSTDKLLKRMIKTNNPPFQLY